eukprot:TRINITY_DN3201_c0_g1_i1.p1 TRINITY_DN3201_c0_g1~~TRINITY_DN3201_c0_g1_i1.p1  ORF type:complete len:229 (+),score=31.42 TRINITY_DN3201_c0_g1_i1:46-687(+)
MEAPPQPLQNDNVPSPVFIRQVVAIAAMILSSIGVLLVWIGGFLPLSGGFVTGFIAIGLVPYLCIHATSSTLTIIATYMQIPRRPILVIAIIFLALETPAYAIAVGVMGSNLGVYVDVCDDGQLRYDSIVRTHLRSQDFCTAYKVSFAGILICFLAKIPLLVIAAMELHLRVPSRPITIIQQQVVYINAPPPAITSSTPTQTPTDDTPPAYSP